MKLVIKLTASLIGYLLIVVGLTLVGCGLAAKFIGKPVAYVPPVLSADKVPPSLERDLFPSIIRLHDADGQFFCSGVVISDRLAATANHCVDRTMMFGPQSFVKAISIRPPNGKDVGISASVVGGFSRSDTALITGDFSGFKKQGIITDVRLDINLLLANHIPLITCGYPWGDRLYCNPVVKRSRNNFAIIAEGNLYPGMSGGPVMLAETGEVVALNTAVADGNIIISPTMSLFVITGAKEQ